MGIYDREYYQEEGPPGLHMRAPRTAVMTLVLINAAIFLIDWLFSGGKLLNPHLEVRVDTIIHPLTWWRFLTYAFMHSSNPWHVIGNMFALWMFGQEVERKYGLPEFLRLYLLMAIGSGIFWSIWGKYVAHLPGASACVGASGAVTGVVVLYALSFPKRTILLFFVVPVPAWCIGVFLVVSDMLGHLSGEGNVAYICHLVGAALAFAYFQSGIRLAKPGGKSKSFPRLKRTSHLKVHNPDSDYQELDEEADLLLKKVHDQGADSLTSREKKVLEQYSRRMQQKRR